MGGCPRTRTRKSKKAGDKLHKKGKRLYYLIQNSQAVKKCAALKKAMVKKRCKIQGGGQEMAVMVG